VEEWTIFGQLNLITQILDGDNIFCYTAVVFFYYMGDISSRSGRPRNGLDSVIDFRFLCVVAYKQAKTAKYIHGIYKRNKMLPLAWQGDQRQTDSLGLGCWWAHSQAWIS